LYRGRVVTAITIVCVAMGASSASAASGTLSSQAVLVVPAGGAASATPAASIPGDSAVGASSWDSSAGSTGPCPSPVADSDSGRSARSVIHDVSIFGGELELSSVSASAQLARSSSAPSVSASVSSATLNGTAVTLPAPGGAPVALGDWGQLSTATSLGG